MLASIQRPTRWCLLALFLLAPPRAETVAAPATSKPADTPSASFSIDDVPEPFVPKTPQTEATRDRLHALALFSAGRALQKREEYPAAMRHYQRALRYDPDAKSVAATIVILANQLQRPAERNRYLLKAAELDPESVDAADLIELTEAVGRERQLRRLIALFEKVLATRAEKKEKSPVDLLLRWRLGELYVVGEQYKKAAECGDAVIEALEHPNRYGLADQVLKQLIEGTRPPYDSFGEYYLLADLPDKAEAAFKKAHDLAPNEGLLSFGLARADARRDQPKAALAHLQTALRQNLAGQGLAPYRLLAKLLDQLGKKDQLIGRLEILLAKNPDNVALGYYLADRYRRADQFDKARPLYAALLQKRPSPLGYAGLAEIYRKTDQPDSLLRLLGDLVAKTTSLDPLGDVAQTLAADAAMMDKLLATARKAAAKDPKQLGQHVPLGVALLAMEAGRADAADEFFHLALRAAPDDPSDLLLVWGGGLLAEGKHAEAAEVFRRGVDAKAASEDRATFYYYLATALELAGQTDEAILAARKAAELKKNTPRVLSQIAWVFYHAKRNDEAIRAYDELIEKFDSDHRTPGTRSLLREARFILSALHMSEGHHAEAEERLEQVLDEFPDDVSAMNDLGYLWAEQKRHLRRALAMVRRAVEAEPDNVAYRDSLGWALYRLGRLEEAAAELEKAVAAGPPEPEILDHLGDVRAKMKQTEKAKNAWCKAAEAYRKAKQPDRANAVEKKRKAESGGESHREDAKDAKEK